MAAESERRIQPDFAGRRVQNLQNLIHADRAVRPRGSMPLFDRFLNLVGILFRVQFLVLLGKLARILAGITDAPPMGRLAFRKVVSGHII